MDIEMEIRVVRCIGVIHTLVLIFVSSRIRESLKAARLCGSENLVNVEQVLL
jgi:UPF0716 family protein affecting phage T7 exclusion